MTCARCHAAIEPGDLRCALCAMAVPGDATHGHPQAQASAQVVRCEGCGAALAYDVEARAPKCAFCGSMMHIEGVEDPLEQAEAALPFKVPPEEAQDALRRWLKGRGFFSPSDLSTDSTVASLQPLWWPAWVFDAEGEVSWAADSNEGARRSSWAPHAGTTRMSFADILVPASRGLSERECLSLADAFETSTAVRNAPGPEGAIVERFDVQRSAARRRILHVTQGLAAKRVTSGTIPGSRFRNVHVSVLLRRLRTRRLSMPTYVLAYRYRDKLYRAVVHGQDATRVLGTSPVSWMKVLAVIVGGAATAALLILLLVLSQR